MREPRSATDGPKVLPPWACCSAGATLDEQQGRLPHAMLQRQPRATNTEQYLPRQAQQAHLLCFGLYHQV
eukprot:1158101-Pelagomonas_calceolata.AAC.4